MVQLAGNSIYNFSICKSHNIKPITSFLWLQQIQSLLCYFNSLRKQKRAKNHIVTSATGIHVTSLVGWSRVTPHSTQYRSFRRRYMSLAKTNQMKNYFICCPCLALFSDTDTILKATLMCAQKLEEANGKCMFYTQGEMTSWDLWSRWDRHFVGKMRRVKWQRFIVLFK